MYAEFISQGLWLNQFDICVIPRKGLNNHDISSKIMGKNLTSMLPTKDSRESRAQEVQDI